MPMKKVALLVMPEDSWEVLHETLEMDTEAHNFDGELRAQIRKALGSVQVLDGGQAALFIMSFKMSAALKAAQEIANGQHNLLSTATDEDRRRAVENYLDWWNGTVVPLLFPNDASDGYSKEVLIGQVKLLLAGGELSIEDLLPALPETAGKITSVHLEGGAWLPDLNGEDLAKALQRLGVDEGEGLNDGMYELDHDEGLKVAGDGTVWVKVANTVDDLPHRRKAGP